MGLKSLIMRNLIIATLIVFCLHGCNVGSDDKTIYDVVFRGSSAGSYVKTAMGDNSFQYTYNYTDRGRGPEVKEDLTLNDQGMIIDLSVSGVNYLKVAVDEFFKKEGQKASWRNSFEESNGEFDGGSLYFRWDGSPAIYEILAQSLAKTANRTVALFPKGEAKLIDQKPFTLSDGTMVELYMISGLDMNPTYIWMKDDQMVAKIAGNLHIVRKDLLDLRTELKRLQDAEEDGYLASLSEKLTNPIEKAVIQNVNVFTPEGAILPNQDVSVEGNRIISVKGTGENLDNDAMIIDGTDKTLMPGLFDMHTHNSKFRGLLHLAGGVTSVRDLANNKQLKDLSEQFDRNEIMGPRIATFCGIIDGSGPYANKRNVVETLEEGLREVQAYKDLGYDQIKLYSSIRPEWVKPLADKAHELGMRVCGHIPAYMTASQAIDQGYNEIQHINMLFLNFLSDTIDTRTPLRFTMPAQYGRDLNLSSDEYKTFVQQLKDNDILVDLTMSIFENMFISQKGEISPTYAAIAERLPLMNQRSFYSGGLPKSDDNLEIYKESYQRMLDVIRDLFESGVDVVPGTDGLPGFLYHRELELYVKAGIPTSEVLKLATIHSAKMTGRSETLGSVEAGKLADLILVDGNPLEDISQIRRVEWTMKGGNLYFAKDLYATQGILHFE